jgi:hypothetical protein
MYSLPNFIFHSDIHCFLPGYVVSLWSPETWSDTVGKGLGAYEHRSRVRFPVMETHLVVFSLYLQLPLRLLL